MWLIPEDIFLNLRGKDKYAIIKEMISKSSIDEKIKDVAWKKVKEREEMQSTSVGNGIGIAHARLENDRGVNLDEELANMMIYQRSFEANARVIRSVDEMLNTLINGML